MLPRIFNIIFILFQNICPGHVLTLIFSLLIMMLSTFICIYIENMRKQVDYIQVKLLRMVNIFANYIYFPPTPILWATFVQTCDIKSQLSLFHFQVITLQNVETFKGGEYLCKSLYSFKGLHGAFFLAWVGIMNQPKCNQRKCNIAENSLLGSNQEPLIYGNFKVGKLL